MIQYPVDARAGILDGRAPVIWGHVIFLIFHKRVLFIFVVVGHLLAKSRGEPDFSLRRRKLSLGNLYLTSLLLLGGDVAPCTNVII
jgi:hypothetical protein